MSGKNESFSGWNGDEKGAPMVIMSPEAASGGGGGGGRITIVLLGITLLFALALAGYSMFRLDQSTREHKAQITELNKQHTAELKALDEKLARARASVLEDKEYATALEVDNAYMKTHAGRPASVLPPPAPERQKYIDELQQENAQRRTPGRVVRETPKRNVWPD